MSTSVAPQGWEPRLPEAGSPAVGGSLPGPAPQGEVKEQTANEKFAAMPGSDLVVAPYSLEPWKALRIMGALMPMIEGRTNWR